MACRERARLCSFMLVDMQIGSAMSPFWSHQIHMESVSGLASLGRHTSGSARVAIRHTTTWSDLAGLNAGLPSLVVSNSSDADIVSKLVQVMSG